MSVIGICPNTKLIAAMERKNKDKFSNCEARYIKITSPIDIQKKTRRGEILSMSHPIATWAKDAHAYTIPAKIPVIATFVERDARLSACDWRASSDLTISDAWKTYRQALRDLPASASPSLDSNYDLDLTSVTWPTEPS